MKTGLSIIAAMLAVALGAPAVASADVVLHEDFESGAPGWSAQGLWHVKNNPQTISVASDINPALVTLPDSGQLPSAVSGTHVAWYGEDSSGTFCTGYKSVTQSPKNGCLSQAANQGRLISPSFSLVGATTAQIAFNAWWEIEAVNADDFDLMKVQYSINGGAWQDIGALNPVNNPAGEHFESYSNNGLETSPSWQTYVANLTPAAGQANVRISFLFDTVDRNYQGFRGLLIDDVDVATPFAADAPQIGSIQPSCVTANAPGQVVAVLGQNFVLGSKLTLDGTEVAGAATLSSTRMEFTASNLAPGNHTLRVVNPLGATSNVATLAASASCDAQPPAPPTPGPRADLRPTGTQVICNRGPNPGDPSRCTATVGDAGAPPRPNPFGTVKFTTTNGSFPQGDSCTLKPTPMSPGVASCEATYFPVPNAGFPEVVARYEGSNVHAASQGQTTFIIAAPSTDGPYDPESECGDSTAGLPRSAPKATASIEREAARTPEYQRGIGYCAWYGASKLFRYTVTWGANGFTIAVGVAAGVGAPVAGTLGGLEVAGPGGAVVGGTTGLAITKEYVYPATTSTLTAINDAHRRAMEDPPDPKFKVVVKPERVKVKRLTARKGLDRRTARAVTRMVRDQIRVRNISRAISATVDKAGGAKVAGDEKWVGIQTRAAMKYSKRLAKVLDRLKDRQRLATELSRKSPLLTQPNATVKQIGRRLQRKAERGFNKRELHYLRTQAGMSDEDIAALRESLRTTDPETVPRSAADLIALSELHTLWEASARTWRAYVQVPSILDDAAKPGSTASSSGPAVASTRLRYKGGRATVTVACGATATPPCQGTVTVRKGKKTLGKGRYQIDEQTSTEIKVKLNKRGRRAMSKGRRHTVTVVVKPSEGTSVSKRLPLTR